MDLHKAPHHSTVVVLGASPNPERYSNMAVKLLTDHGFKVIPVHPARPQIGGMLSLATLSEIREQVDTITVYVNPSISEGLLPEILSVKPRRVIFNPGAENAHLADELRRHGIEIVEACTLVMLGTGQF